MTAQSLAKALFHAPKVRQPVPWWSNSRHGADMIVGAGFDRQDLT